MKAFIVRCVVIGLLTYMPLQSMAWGLLGHRVIGEVAEYYLQPSAKKKIREILGNETLAMAANWADFIKSDSNYKYLDPWHYVNFEKGITYPQMVQFLATDTSVNAYNKLMFLIAELKKENLPQQQKVMYLRLLIHIVGDLHQPLHVSAVGTVGGNRVRVNWFNEPTNLHRVWDTHMIQSQELSYTEITCAINHTTKAERMALQKQPITEWLYDSYTLANTIHDDIKEPNEKLGYNYIFKHQQTMYDQLLKGGIRLAGILNDIY